ncbi:MAG: terminase [Mycobacteriales bacterium]
MRSTASASKKRFGRTTPRIYTPPLRRLTKWTTLGLAVIEFAEQVLGIILLPWQKWLLVHALELLPDGTPRFRTVIVLVARQNGKSTLSIVLSLFFMYVLGRGLVIGTAQDLDVAEEIWQNAVDLVEETPELNALKKRVVQKNGSKALELKTGERYKVKAANRGAGRSLSGDLILLDELREHQSWDAWAALTKTAMARELAMIWALSNAGDASSLVLRYLRRMAHAAVGDPDGLNADEDPSSLLPSTEDLDDEALDADELEVAEDDSLGIFEWSAEPGCAVTDRDGWAQANPSLGYLISERTIASACRTDPEWVFRVEVLCQWSEGTLEGPFPPGSWEATTDNASKVADGGQIVVGVDVSWDRSKAHIAIAGYRDDGVPHVGVVASRAGVDWVLPWLLGPDAPPFSGVVVQTNGPASSLVEPLRRAGLRVVDWAGTDLGRGTGAFYDSVRSRKVRHRPQPVLDVAAANASVRPMGDAYVWDRKKSPVDVAPLVAVTGALWALASDQLVPDVPSPAPVLIESGSSQSADPLGGVPGFGSPNF